MTIEEIKELIQVVNETGIAELEVSRGDNRVRIRRSNPPVIQDVVLPSAPAVAASPASVASAVVAPAATPAQSLPPASTQGVVPTGPVLDDRTVYVKSPIVGTFYESPSPGAPPFVKPGDRVSVGQVLCIIESMKLMNEIEADVAGTLVARLVETGRPVEYGESLFAIQPA